MRMRKAYQLTLNEWEEMLARGLVSFVRGRPLFGHSTIIIKHTANDYAWIELLPSGKIWKERHATTLLELFLLAAIDDEAVIGDTVIDADADHIAALPEAGA